MKKYGKFAALIAVVIGTLVWLATAGMSSSKTYYKTISELQQMGDQAYGQRIRVGGDVAAGSIQRVGGAVVFTLMQDNNAHLKVAYTGTDPLPDTFKDGAQALADGKLDKDGVFRASQIQAKCASKYESKPGQMAPGQMPVNRGPGAGGQGTGHDVSGVAPVPDTRPSAAAAASARPAAASAEGKSAI
jgi:cytochrome c-type biogenesis protein CcmE